MLTADIVAIVAVGLYGALWRRALGGWGTIPGGLLRLAAGIPALPLFILIPWPVAAVITAASYLHFMPSHHGLLDYGDTGEGIVWSEFWRDFGGMALRYTAIPAALAYLGAVYGYQHLEILLRVGLATAIGYALGYAAKYLRLFDRPTETGEVVMGSTFWTSVIWGVLQNV